MISIPMRRAVFWFTVLGALAFVLLPLLLVLHGAEPRTAFHASLPALRPLPETSAYPAQLARWRTARVNPRYSIALDKLVERYRRHETTYRQIEAMREHGVPAPVLFGLHYRESDADFSCHPHEGSPLTHRTRYVPKGRPTGDPPFTFLQSAEDAYYGYEHLEKRAWHEPGAVCYWSESFNGLGYMKRGRVSPYVWSGTDAYQRGKYVADGRYDPLFVDKQLGVAAILFRLRERGIALAFD